MDCGVEMGVYSEDLDIFLSFRLPDTASIFQAAVLGIEKACGDHWIAKRHYSYSLVNKARKALSSLTGQLEFFLIWVPGHWNVFGYETQMSWRSQESLYTNPKQYRDC